MMQSPLSHAWLVLGCGLALLMALALGAPPAAAVPADVDASAPSSSAAAAGSVVWSDDLAADVAAAEGDAGAAPSARAASAPATSAAPRLTLPATFEHGLAPLPGGARVPLSDRPPGATEDDGGPSPVVFPAQQLTIRFNHKRHVQELGLGCTACHDKARTSRQARDDLIPKGTRCDACHGSDHRNLDEVRSDATDLTGQCGFCHIGYVEGAALAPLEIPPPNLRFDHRKHVSRNIQCAQCHGEVQNIELATRDQLPRMRGCFRCHQAPASSQGDARGACTTCHLTEPSGRVRTEFASGHLSPPRWLHDAEHGPDWIERHKAVAGADSQLCATCHSERFCTDCHDGRVRSRRVHPGDWLSQHPVAARLTDPNCTSCHREQTFCVGCHQRVGVTMGGPFENFSGRGRFHPSKAIWTDGPRGSGHHAWEAQRNLNACVSCHVEQDCAVCHATQGRGGRGGGPGEARTNPHPPGFLSRCGGALRKNARACLTCHTPGDQDLESCR